MLIRRQLYSIFFEVSKFPLLTNRTAYIEEKDGKNYKNIVTVSLMITADMRRTYQTSQCVQMRLFVSNEDLLHDYMKAVSKNK